MDQRASGWYEDPQNPELLRYWDGVVWTEHTAWRRPQQVVNPGAGNRDVQDRLGDEQVGHSSAAAQERAGQPSRGNEPFVSGLSRGPAHMEDSRLSNGAWGAMGKIAADGRELAPWWRRAVAYVVDAFVMALLAMPFAYPAMARSMPSVDAYFAEALRQAESGAATLPTMPQDVAMTMATVGFITTVVRFAYEIITVRQWGGGLGKMLVGIRVRGFGGHGRLSWAGSVRRAVFKNVYSLLAGIPLLGWLALGYTVATYLWPLWDPQRQALHDKLAGTELVVVGRDDRNW